MEKVEQEEIVFDNISEYSSAFPRYIHKQTNNKQKNKTKNQEPWKKKVEQEDIVFGNLSALTRCLRKQTSNKQKHGMEKVQGRR